MTPSTQKATTSGSDKSTPPTVRRRSVVESAGGQRRRPHPPALVRLEVTVARIRHVDPTNSILRKNLHSDRLRLDAALIAQHVYVAAAWIDKALPRRVDMPRATWVVSHVVRHRSGQDQDQARTRVRVPARRPSRRKLVVDGVDVGLSLRLEPSLPEVGRNRVGLDVDLVEERLRQDR